MSIKLAFFPRDKIRMDPALPTTESYLLKKATSSSWPLRHTGSMPASALGAGEVQGLIPWQECLQSTKSGTSRTLPLLFGGEVLIDQSIIT